MVEKQATELCEPKHGNQNTDVGEIDHYVFYYVRVMFCVSGVCNKSNVPQLTLIFIWCFFFIIIMFILLEI